MGMLCLRAPRLYGMYGLRLKQIKIRMPLEKLVKGPELYSFLGTEGEDAMDGILARPSRPFLGRFPLPVFGVLPFWHRTGFSFVSRFPFCRCSQRTVSTNTFSVSGAALRTG